MCSIRMHQSYFAQPAKKPQLSVFIAFAHHLSVELVLVVVSGTLIVFSVLTRGTSKLHLAVLEELSQVFRKLNPEQCVQKENVLALQLFGTIGRECITKNS